MPSDMNKPMIWRNLPPPLTPKIVGNVGKFQNFWGHRRNKGGAMWNDLRIRLRVGKSSEV